MSDAEVYVFIDNSFLYAQGYKHARAIAKLSWLCKAPTCPGHRMQVLDWGLCELQRRDGSEAALNRMKDLCRLDVYDAKFFLGNLFLYPASFMIVGIWYPRRVPNLLFR